jgi:hypothetical protein
MLEITFPIFGVILTNIFGLNIFKSYLDNRKKLIQNYNEILFYVIFNNMLCWLLYSILIKDIFIFLSCILTLISSFGFISIMYKYIKLEKLIYIEIISLIGLIYFIIIIYLINFTNIKSYIIEKIVGITCIFMDISSNTLPFLIIYKVIKTKNTELIYLPHATINFINHLCWLLYSIINYNIYLLISNIISIGLLLFQIIVYIYVKINKKDDMIILIKDYTTIIINDTNSIKSDHDEIH